MSVRLSVHVTPKSNRDEVVGWRGGELRLRVTAPPEDGKANAAVCKFLGKSLGVPKSAIRVVVGPTSRHKQLEIEGIGSDAIHRVFGGTDDVLS